MATVTAVGSGEGLSKVKSTIGSVPPNGNGRNGRGPGGGGPHGSDDSDNASEAEKYRIGIWVVLAGIAMMFTALTSAYIVRSVSIDGSRDWQPIAMPRMLPVSTALIVLSSVTFGFARRMLKQGRKQQYRNWLLATGVLGVGFLVSQLFAWRELVAQGIYLASNPHSSFFYLLIAAHAVHLIFGLLALAVLIFKSGKPGDIGTKEYGKQTRGAHAVSIYWHFMDGLWIYLFLLLFVWR